MKIEVDSSKQSFIEIPMQNNEMVRITYIKDSWSGMGGVRLQIKESTGHLRQGPEIPVNIIGDVVSAVIKLIQLGKER